VINVVEIVGLLLYGLWKISRAAGGRQVRPDLPPVHVVRAARLEADPVRSSPAAGSWTARDERQLIRLLKDSAP
jgi:hypothetical protein